ncbi:MAG: hypothetical protein LBB81_05720 [Treponema sp.]|jgi:hypothetical protein|nr:hypothetical protein [Treponema sp.]
MRFLLSNRTTARLFFITGIIFLFLGCIFLPDPQVKISSFFTIIYASFLVLGIVFMFLTIKIQQTSLYLFLAAFAIQTAVFLFLSGISIIPVTLSKAWPLISIFSGIALIPAAGFRFGKFHIKYMVASVFFIALGSILMVFSLDLVSFSFLIFVRDWWPLLIALSGLIFVLASLGHKNTGDIKR